MMDRQPEKPGTSPDAFPPGSLWDRVCATSERALRKGALQPIDTKATYCADRGVPFLIRVLSSLRNKPHGNDDHNPFLPYEAPLYVADASASHVCILNKYKVVDLHLLIITRAFEHQESLLTRRDFAALWRCLREYESLGFYNSGTLAGASQRHKHLQLVPLPLVTRPDGSDLPLDELLDASLSSEGTITQLDLFPFRHAFVRLGPFDETDLAEQSTHLLDCYRRMLCQVGIDLPRSEAVSVATPYNLLVSRRWMLLVPRLRECTGSISLNALAFVGTLLVHNSKQLEQLRQMGPFNALQAVAMPR